MSLLKNSEPLNMEEFEDENETFHSFEQSDNDSLGNLSNIDDLTIIDEPQYDLEADATIKLNLDQCHFRKQSPLPKPHVKDHYMVHKSTPFPKMPAAELFDMNVQTSSKSPLNTSPDTAAMQKFAFTEIWVEGQQSNQPRQRSLSREFTAALDNYFKEDDTDQFAKLSLQDQQKGKINQGLFVDPYKSTSGLSASFQTIAEDEPYVSPFEDMPKAPEMKPIPGLKPYVIVPAGFDLTNLVEYKNPNHWHRRLTTLHEDSP